MSKDTGGPAFPVDWQTARSIAIHEVGTDNEQHYLEAVARLSSGMTLRDYFAAKALPALIRSAPYGTAFGENNEETNLTYAFVSYAVADAMLKAREE